MLDFIFQYITGSKTYLVVTATVIFLSLRTCYCHLFIFPQGFVCGNYNDSEVGEKVAQQPVSDRNSVCLQSQEI